MHSQHGDYRGTFVRQERALDLRAELEARFAREDSKFEWLFEMDYDLM
jgi:hypothetical protein